MFKPGHKKIGGRQKGSVNLAARQIREAYAEILQNNIDKLAGWLEEVAAKDPEKALNIHIEISKRFVPVLQAIKVEGEIQHRLMPPNITILPQAGQTIHLPVESTQIEIEQHGDATQL